MIADSWSAKRWNEPFGAGSETTRGLVRAATVRSRGARASTELRLAVSSVRGRNFRAWTATFRPGRRLRLRRFRPEALSSVGVLERAQLLADCAGSALCAETVAASYGNRENEPEYQAWSRFMPLPSSTNSPIQYPRSFPVCTASH